MALNNQVSEELYNTKKESLIKELNATKADIELFDKANHNLITAFYLASKTYDLFICSKNEEKRQLINLVFLNMQLRDKNL